MQDLIDKKNMGNSISDYPSELKVFIGKEMLFKVEITDGNLLHNWRNYAVKRSSDDLDLIGRFKILHNIKTFAEEDGVDDRGAKEESLSHDVTIEKLLIESGDSTKSDNK